MSETETGPQPGGEAPEAAVTETEATAPVDAGAATETETETKPTEEQPKPSRADRRFAAMSARLAAQAAEIEELRRGGQQSPPAAPTALPQTPEELQAVVRAEASKLAAEERTRERVAAFHAAGQAAHSDWAERCQNLQAMGADAQMSHILIEMDDGARVAGALADDPEALERIAGIRTERGRAIALGKFAASLPEARPARTPVSRAPAPIRPVTGVANPTFNEYTASAEQLMEFYSKQAMERRRA
jgi:hypothetical protein